MNKVEFFQKFERSLRGLPKEEKQNIIADFEEHFRNSAAEGRSEAETAETLGNPLSIGRLAKTELLVLEAEKNKTAKNVFRAVLAAAGLGLFNIIVVIGPFFGIVGVLIGLWAAALSLTLSGIGTVAAMAFTPLFRYFIGYPVTSILFALFAGIGLTAFGGLFGIGMVYVTKWFAKITLGYVKATVRIIKGKE